METNPLLLSTSISPVIGSIVLTSSTAADAVNVNTRLEIGLENTNKPLPLNDIDTTLSQYEQFLKERKESTVYRFYGEINAMVSNPIYNENVKIARDSNTNNVVGKDIPGYEIFEKNGWIGYFNDTPNEELEIVGDNESSLCEFFPFDPGYERLNMLDSDGKPNYMLKITYPHQKEDITLIQGGLSLSAGIPVLEKIPISQNGSEYVAFKTPINHGLEKNDKIKLYGFNDLSGNLALSSREFLVYKLGDQNENNKEHIFVIEINPQDIGVVLGNSTIKRIVGDTPSSYYARKFKTLSNSYSDYDIYPAAFGVNYYEDSLAAFNFITDIDIEGKVDNLGRPLSEVYLTIVKNDNDTDPTNKNAQYWIQQQSSLPANIRDRFWTPIKGGFKTEKNSNLNYNIRGIGDPDYSNSLYFNNIDESDTEFMGDIVEYNESELLERTLENVYHRINTIYREHLYEISSALFPINSVTGTFRGGQGISIEFTASQNLKVSDFPSISSVVSLCFINRNTNLPECIDVILTQVDGVNPTVRYININPGNNNLNSVLQDGDFMAVSFNGCPCSENTNPLKSKYEGYIYKPHSKIQIREFSSVITPLVDLQSVFDQYGITSPSEQQKIKEDYDIPSYALEVTPNVYKWRPLLDIGEVDAVGNSVDYPFESGAHYIHLYNTFYLHRQDPPCDFYVTSQTIKLPAEADLFKKLLKDPTFIDYGARRGIDINIMQYKPVENVLDYNGQVTMWGKPSDIAACTQTPLPLSKCFFSKEQALNTLCNPATCNQNFFNISNVIRLEELQIDLRFIHFYGDYNLGKRDTAGACVSFNILDTKDISDEC